MVYHRLFVSAQVIRNEMESAVAIDLEKQAASILQLKILNNLSGSALVRQTMEKLEAAEKLLGCLIVFGKRAPFEHLWGRLLICGRLSIGQLPRFQQTAAVANRRAGYHPAPLGARLPKSRKRLGTQAFAVRLPGPYRRD